ncbi:MAG TPA: hypothetical protein VEC43_05135 [Candidatus Acidoferrales bacterium]|nr:hypothetical protein [Candidatus Acidoferrales bacterium]
MRDDLAYEKQLVRTITALSWYGTIRHIVITAVMAKGAYIVYEKGRIAIAFPPVITC